MNNPFTLEGKVILVTGASSGIGRGIAIECSKMGAQLIISARNPIRLQETLDMMEGSNHQYLTADLAAEQGISDLTDQLPALDGIVHVAGIVKPKPFKFLNRKELDEIMNINFFGPIILTNGLIRKNLIKKHASVVFISSISGTICSFIGGSSYSASKGALNGIIKGIALDLASKQIRVNSIMPGMIDTAIFDNSSISQESLASDRLRYPLGRYGKPEDVAYAAIYLLSDASSWVTGSNLLLDGGYTLI